MNATPVYLTLTLLAITLGLSGCATGYGPSGFSGGYEDMKIQDNIYRVSFTGNAYTNKREAADFAMLRCAELTLENGAKYFAVVTESDDSQTFVDTTPRSSSTTYNAYSNSLNTQYYGGETIFYSKPSSSYTIQIFSKKPSGFKGFLFDAKQISSNLKKQYNINK
jgi:hypothetical protein